MPNQCKDSAVAVDDDAVDQRPTRGLVFDLEAYRLDPAFSNAASLA